MGWTPLLRWTAPCIAIFFTQAVSSCLIRRSMGQTFTRYKIHQSRSEARILSGELESVPQMFLPVNAPRLQCTRLSLGVSSAPAIFQRDMETLLQDMTHVVYFEDILGSGSDVEDHLKNVQQVLWRKEEVSLKLKFIEVGELKPRPQKVEAVVNAPLPVDLMQLQGYLGLISYYRNFIPYLSSVLQPFYHHVTAHTS